jgi:hypothetical protein
MTLNSPDLHVKRSERSDEISTREWRVTNTLLAQVREVCKMEE